MASEVKGRRRGAIGEEHRFLRCFFIITLHQKKNLSVTFLKSVQRMDCDCDILFMNVTHLSFTTQKYNSNESLIMKGIINN